MFSVQMWFYFLCGLRSDMWAVLPAQLAKEVLGHVLSETLQLLVQRYNNVRPSYGRQLQVRCISHASKLDTPPKKKATLLSCYYSCSLVYRLCHNFVPLFSPDSYFIQYLEIVLETMNSSIKYKAILVALIKSHILIKHVLLPFPIFSPELKRRKKTLIIGAEVRNIFLFLIPRLSRSRLNFDHLLLS